MYLTKHRSPSGPRWALDGHWLPSDFCLGLLLQGSAARVPALLQALVTGDPAEGELLAPVDPDQEVWASGVTYLRSREARESETQVKDIYDKVYEAARPELFLKSVGQRVVGHGAAIRMRRDARWTVPEPELVIVINAAREIVGHCAGNDVSSRDIEGENPLYLPQAKVYDGSCALGPGIVLESPASAPQLQVQLAIVRAGQTVFTGDTTLAQIKRPLQELADYLMRELSFPRGALLFTGTGIVPPDHFTLALGDEVSIRVGTLTLVNRVE